jgi:hypothetical protein
MSSADTQFSKVRLETLCDGIVAPYAAAMTPIGIGLTARRLGARR